jgi:hypothetical protein
MSMTSTSRARTGFFAEGRRRSAIALLVGALLMEVLIQQQHVRFYYTPLIVGLTYLAAAGLAGRKGALWAPGIITICWGIAVLLGVHGVTHGGKTSYEIAGVIGIGIALTLRYTIGLAAGYIGMAVAFVIILLHDHSNIPSWVFQGITFAVLLGVWGLWELRPTHLSRTPLRDDHTGHRVEGTRQNEASSRV